MNRAAPRQVELADHDIDNDIMSEWQACIIPPNDQHMAIPDFPVFFRGLSPQGFYGFERRLSARAIPDGFSALGEALAAVIEEKKGL